MTVCRLHKYLLFPHYNFLGLQYEISVSQAYSRDSKVLYIILIVLGPFTPYQVRMTAAICQIPIEIFREIRYTRQGEVEGPHEVIHLLVSHLIHTAFLSPFQLW